MITVTFLAREGRKKSEDHMLFQRNAKKIQIFLCILQKEELGKIVLRKFGACFDLTREKA